MKLIIGAIALTAGLSWGTPMPVARQNALVQTYCAVCHDDAHRNGGISFQRFDAAHADPGDAAMMVAKLKTGALGAAGVQPPDDATVDALVDALSAKAVGADKWTVNRAAIVSASIVREVPSTDQRATVPDLYRLTLTCNADTHKAEMQLAWAPATPKNGQVMSVSVDGRKPLTYTIEGTETMGNGTNGTSGPGATVLDRTPLPAQTLTVSDVLPEETVVFPFGDLTPSARQALSKCFPGEQSH